MGIDSGVEVIVFNNIPYPFNAAQPQLLDRFQPMFNQKFKIGLNYRFCELLTNSVQ